MSVAAAAATQNLLSNSNPRLHAIHSLYACRTRPKPQLTTLPSLPNCARSELLRQRAPICRIDFFSPCRWRIYSFDSTGDGIENRHQRDEVGEFNLDTFLSTLEILCIVPSAILSIGFAVNNTFLAPQKSIQASLFNKCFAWQFVFLVGAVAISSLIRQRQWRRICRVSYKTGSESFNLINKIEKLEEDIKSSATIIRVLSRHLEKLGIRFRVTRKSLKGPIAETAALAQKNSEATRALALQEDILEKELAEIQKALLAMQDQQRKQLELIVAIGKAGRIRESRQDPAADVVIPSHNSVPEKEEVKEMEAKEGGPKGYSNSAV